MKTRTILAIGLVTAVLLRILLTVQPSAFEGNSEAYAPKPGSTERKLIFDVL